MDKDAQPDFRIEYRQSKLRIECKNVARKPVRGMPKVDFQKTLAARGNYCSRYYTPDQFEILAACLHPLSERWELKFCPTARLDAHPRCKGHLSEHVRVGGDDWAEHLRKVLDRLTR